ncbi:MAG: N-acetylmuramoyl-L-alanine amidase [Leptospirales bacterium]
MKFFKIKNSYKVLLLVVAIALVQISLEAASLTVVEINNKKYIQLEHFTAVDSNIRGKVDPLTLVVELHYKTKKVRLKIGYAYYVSEGEQYQLQYPPIIKNSVVYLPIGLTEELLSELNIPVKYRYDGNDIDVVTVTPTPRFRAGEKIKLDFIVLDPGHGGKDPGAKGREKEVTLEVSRYLFHYLQKKLPKTKIYITRYNDEYITLADRSKIANRKLKQHQFGIFISIHCNSTLQKSVHGYEIYYLAQNADSEQARQVMLRENFGETNGFSKKSPVTAIESLLFDAQLMSESKVLARALNRTFMTHFDGLVSARGIKRADFAVLRGSMMPAVLFEMGYISNANEAVVLRSKKYREKLSIAIVEAVQVFMQNLPRL